MSLPLSTTLAAATAISGIFTAYTGWKTYSIRSKGYASIKTLLGLGNDVYGKFANFYDQHKSSRDTSGTFLPTFIVRGYTIEYYINFFSQENFEPFIKEFLQKTDTQSLQRKIAENFQAIQKLTSSYSPATLIKDKAYIEAFVSTLPKSDELLDQIEPIVAMAKTGYTAPAIWGVASVSSVIAYAVIDNSDSKELSGAINNDD
jgi:hypothetical protein